MDREGWPLFLCVMDSWLLKINVMRIFYFYIIESVMKFDEQLGTKKDSS